MDEAVVSLAGSTLAYENGVGRAGAANGSDSGANPRRLLQ